MFALTRKTDYAVIALSHLAQSDGAVSTAREIAEQYGLPQALLMNVLKSMSHGTLVRSVRGAKGGYVLASPAEEITLTDIIESVEGPVRFVQCTGEGAAGDSCDLVHSCPVTRPVRKVHDRLTTFLNNVTLAQIAFDPDYGCRSVPVSVEGSAIDRAEARA